MTPPPEPRVIINADDLGASAEVNRAVFDLMAEGRLTSATILVAGAAVGEATRSVPQFPRCSFGVHLYLTEYPPLTRQAAFAPLLDRTGAFRLDAIRAVRPTRALVNAVADEWCAQIARARQWRIPVSHLDSHHHVHTVRWMLPALKRVQRATGISRVRISLNLYDTDEQRPSPLVRLEKGLFNTALRWWPPARTTRAMTKLRWFARLATRQPIDLPTIELMTHPGNAFFAEETALLRTDWRAALRVPVSLMSYHDL